MKRFDMHIHAEATTPDPAKLIEAMDAAGIYGGCIFSNWPKEANPALGTSFEERLNEVLEWTRGYEDRLFSVLWIHPYEEDIHKKIRIAVEQGVCAFKIICTNFFVNEEPCLALLHEIAALGKPVFFHSGILWDGSVSSEYNRPLHWEALLQIEGLRFSMGHCSWPWIDECIALYGKFLNTLTVSNTAEMFFDITPGTPEIYREELLRKLYTIGYDMGDNIMFGTDSSAHTYSDRWVEKWLNLDRKILNKLGVSKANQRKLYYDNLLRFLGKDPVVITHTSPVCDDNRAWSPVNENVSNIISSWYHWLDFPSIYDDDFEKALAEIPISDALSISDLDPTEKDGRRNFLSVLFLCEALKKRYEDQGIPLEVLYDTLQDIVIWTNIWSSIKGELYLGEIDWLKRHLSMRLFKLGRLQFCMGGLEHDVPTRELHKGDSILEIHIDSSAPLNSNACTESIIMAKAFFAAHFPAYHYRCFTCHSWILDQSLAEVLPQDSNLLHFQNRFDVLSSEPSDAILKYLFAWNTTRYNLNRFHPSSSFSKKVQYEVLSGKQFNEAFGILKE